VIVSNHDKHSTLGNFSKSKAPIAKEFPRLQKSERYKLRKKEKNTQRE